MGPMTEGEISRNQAIAALCSDLDELREVVNERGTPADVAKLSHIVQVVQTGGDLDAAKNDLVTLTAQLVPNFLEKGRAALTLPPIGPSHGGESIYICPGKPPICGRAENPGTGSAPRCSLRDAEMELVYLT